MFSFLALLGVSERLLLYDSEEMRLGAPRAKELPLHEDDERWTTPKYMFSFHSVRTDRSMKDHILARKCQRYYLYQGDAGVLA